MLIGDIIDTDSGNLMILVMLAIVVTTLIILVPQLLRAHLRKMEMQHAENMRALENGQEVAPVDERSRVAGRTAMLVPMVTIISAATVTCFLAAYKSENGGVGGGGCGQPGGHHRRGCPDRPARPDPGRGGRGGGSR